MKITGTRKYKILIGLGCGIALSIGILTFSTRVTTPNRDNPYFSYGAGDNRNGAVQVMDDSRIEVPVVFAIEKNIREIRLEFSGEHKLLPGARLRDTVVAVVDGRAMSTLILQFNKNTGLKAGTHNLTLVARDPATGEIVRQGKVQFTYNMHEVIGKCSC